MIAFVRWVGSPQIDKRPEVQPVLYRRFRYELPHPLRVAFSGHRAADKRVEITFLQGEIKELRGKTLGQQFIRNPGRVSVFFRRLDGLGVPTRRLPLLDVFIDLVGKTGWHLQFAFSEDARHPQHKPLLLGHLGVVDMECGQEMIVILLNLFPTLAIFLDLVDADLTARLGYEPLEVCDIEI